MSDLPELPPLPEPESSQAAQSRQNLSPMRFASQMPSQWYSRAQMLSFAREALDRGRRAGLEGLLYVKNYVEERDDWPGREALLGDIEAAIRSAGEK